MTVARLDTPVVKILSSIGGTIESVNKRAGPGSTTARSRTVRTQLMVTTVFMIVSTSCSLVSDGTESYRPPAADIVPLADCTLPDIVHLLQYGENNSGDNIPKEGSLPSGFTPSSVVLCELTQGDGTSGTVDAVSLGGDVGAFADAVNRPSQRADENTSYSCAYRVEAPAAVYLVSPSGAVRMTWPGVICGYRDDPLGPLEALVETGRTRAEDLGYLVPNQCTQSFNVSLSSDPGPDTASPPVKRPTLRLPDREVMGLTACTYRVAKSSAGDADTALTRRTRLSGDASTRLMREVIAAPAARPCDVDASEIVSLDLYRPDGSGGGELQVETDGCRRLVVRDLIGYRQASDDIIALVRSGVGLE
ncbi:hypothetical protein GCM10009619_41020 [Williamsia maris]